MKKELINIYKSISGNLEFAFRKFDYAKDELIVLCMHSTPSDRMRDFLVLVEFLKQRFKPLRPEQLEHYYQGGLNDGPYILFTFDDGLKNNLHVAEILESQEIRAYFFLIPDFIQAKDQKAYYLKNIRSKIDPTFDNKVEDFIAMSYQDVAELIRKGHAAGSHTMSHLLRAGMKPESQLVEIRDSLALLRAELGPSINSFCSPINTSISVDHFGKQFINECYKYHFTTFPGLNGKHKNPQLIFRRNIEVNWSKGKVNFALGKWDLPRWQSGILQFQSL